MRAEAPPPVTVLFVLASFDTGGVQRMVIDLLTHIDRRRVRPIVAVSRRAGGLAEAVPAECRVHDLGRRGRYDFPLLVSRLGRVLCAESPDVIFALQFHGNLLALAARAASRVSVPVIISEHVAVDGYRRGPAWVRALMRAAYRLADGAVAVSSGVGGELTTQWGVPAADVTVIQNPIDLEAIRAHALAPLDLPGDPRQPVIVSVGRFTAQKNFSCLLRAFARVRPMAPARLVLVGGGEERGRLERLAGELEIAPHVTFAGMDPNPYRWMARASVCALASIYEGFGIVLAEAMALGVPTVATDCPHGPAEILRGGLDGLLVPPGDEHALAAALLRTLREPALRDHLAQAGRRRAEAFGARRIAGLYERLFEHEARASAGQSCLRLA